MNAILETKALNKRFGGLHVTRDVDLRIERQDLHFLVGPNGAGKSTLFKCLAGVYRSDAGSIKLNDVEIAGTSPHARVRMGLGIKFQAPSFFPELTVEENFRVAVIGCDRFRPAPADIEQLLQSVQLDRERKTLAGTLAHGQKQWLEIGLAIATQPQVLMLDEPTAGMSPLETSLTGELLRRLNEGGITIIVVDHDMKFVKTFAKRVTVLHLGAVFRQGAPQEVLEDEDVIRIYLGKRR